MLDFLGTANNLLHGVVVRTCFPRFFLEKQLIGKELGKILDTSRYFICTDGTANNLLFWGTPEDYCSSTMRNPEINMKGFWCGVRSKSSSSIVFISETSTMSFPCSPIASGGTLSLLVHARFPFPSQDIFSASCIMTTNYLT